MSGSTARKPARASTTHQPPFGVTARRERQRSASVDFRLRASCDAYITNSRRRHDAAAQRRTTMATTAYTTAKAAVARSISNDEVAVLALPLRVAQGASERVEAALEALKAFGLEDHDDATDDAGQVVRAWGTHEGKEWTVRTIDGTLSDVRYVR